MPIFTNSIMAENDSTVDLDLLENSLQIIKNWKNNGRRVLIDEKGIEFIRRWYAKNKINGCCPLGNTDIFLESNGDIRTGCWVLPPIGNIRETPIEDILISEKYKENILKMQQRICPGCTCGYLMQSKFMD